MLNPDPKGLAVIGAFILLAFLAGLGIVRRPCWRHP
jgi:hypothetical protein